jgi:phosphoribosylglycinamide formyltransferase-1
MGQNQLRLASLVSGGGTTMRAILRECGNGDLQGAVKPVLVIASKPNIGAITKAREDGIDKQDIVLIERKNYPTSELFGEMILAECRKRDVNFIGQYGWMPLTPANVTRHYAGRMVNQHPGPLDPGHPDFGGQGMYGSRVHAARLLFSRMTCPKDEPQWTEVVSHYVTPEFDKGSVIFQERVPLLPKDTVEDLQKRALEAEWRVQIQTIRAFYLGCVPAVERQTRLILPHEHFALEIAKRMAIMLYPNG